MSDLINQVEAILFSFGKKVDSEYVRKLCHVKDVALINEALEELKRNYDERGGSLQVVQEGELWRLTVRDAYAPLVRKIVPDTDMSKTLMQTMAVIAWKQPITQSEVIKIRTNKAYDHVKQLTDMGFVTSERYGRTRKLKLTQKFLDYFDLKGIDDIKELFKQMRAKETEKEETSKQSEVARLVEGIRQAVEEQSLVSEAIDQDEDKMGKLDVYEEPEEDKKEDKETKQEFSTDEQALATKEINQMLGEDMGEEGPEEEKTGYKAQPEKEETDEVEEKKKLGDIDGLMDEAEED